MIASRLKRTTLTHPGSLSVFDIYETVVVFVSILVVNYAISDGKTNWLEGLVLMVIYMLIALTTWYYVSWDPTSVRCLALTVFLLQPGTSVA